ncbi:MAG: bifunctional ADP-dependent NAD(P)H-hydrate dehydratase/NAD(P)H-hydrate epimerase, partial [Solirubrobacterales bacterium]|nr:bifunctional ADP-dependent NAD(P)H-hydrate dehydratase/NAD(P)H-hydrate epimerase [Solirubrobacterales bacterium]
WIEPGKSHSGRVVVADIGIPPGAPVDPAGGLISDHVRDGIPRRLPGSTKFASGTVLVCGGSPGLTGAPCLASRAAMRAGAGYVTACVPSSLSLVFEIALTEVMSIGLPDVDGVVTERAAETVLERSRRADAVALGPGLGREPEVVAYARRLAGELDTPLVLDADGLNAHSGALFRLAMRSAPAVLTPHGGELARLLDVTNEEVRARRLELALEAARGARAIVVLKGDDSIVATPEGRYGVSRGGAPGLATAGTGDVLTGVVAAFLAKRMDPFQAACAAVHVHVRAGQLAAEDAAGPDGVIASDVIERLPRALGTGG